MLHLNVKMTFNLIFKQRKDILIGIIPIPSAPSASIVSNNQSIQQSIEKLTKTNSSFITEHPLIKQLFECKHAKF
jgi:hypothetical protein